MVKIAVREGGVIMGYMATPFEWVEHLKNERDYWRAFIFMFHDVMKNGRRSEVLKHFNSLYSNSPSFNREWYESRLTGKNKTWGKKEFLNYLSEMLDKEWNVEEWREHWRERWGSVE